MFRCFHNEIRALAPRALRSPFVSLPSLTFVSAGDVPRTRCGRFRIKYRTQRDNPSTMTFVFEDEHETASREPEMAKRVHVE